mmetsp:Transcript_46749/g.77407  ORF Transcript_46749/g.77407 Transcript_46749/m.77407 type:complete len:284 (+) Transcript_46749:38-889(+)
MLATMTLLLLSGKSIAVTLTPLPSPGRVPLRAVPKVSRSTVPGAVIPKGFALIFAVPWGIQISYAVEASLGIEGFATRIRNSDLVQKGGGKMRSLKKEPPKVKGVRLTPEVSALTQTFKKEYAPRDLEVLWGALIKCYGSKELALQAVQSNPQIINPSYSFCNTMLESKRVLEGVMTAEEALEVMQLNPAVLQCGPSLDVLGAAEIKGIARLRSLGNTLVPQQLRGAAVGFLLASVLLAIGANVIDYSVETEALLTVLKPVLGGVLGFTFLFALYGAANSGRS